MYSAPSPYRIIAVCTGNICRSPMVELMLREALAQAGLHGQAVVDSAGTTSYEAGRPIDHRAARVLTSHHIASGNHVARAWQPGWFDERDLILALDVDHYGWLRAAAPDAAARAKIRMLRSFDPTAATGHTLDQGIEDPWYGGHSDFESTWELIRDAVPGIVEHVAAVLAERKAGEQQVRSIP